MTTAIEYALMAGASYISNRNLINQFPVPSGWLGVKHDNQPSGFEAISFINGASIATSTDIVISFAGTDDNGKGLFSNADKQADLLLGLGLWSDQLGQAAAYYLDIKAVNSSATISFTGHSLGGGLASLMSVFFGESAFTFDQAPFAASATQAMRSTLVNYLTNHGYTTQQLASLSPGLFTFIFDPAIGAQRVTDINVNGEFLSSTAPYNWLGRIGTQAVIPNSTIGVDSGDLHSQAQLTTFLQSNQTAATNKALSDVTLKLTDLLGMMFDKKLYAFSTAKSNDKNVNFLDRLVQQQAAAIDPATGMVTRFTNDMWKIAPDTGTFAPGSSLGKALIDAAIEDYYFMPNGSSKEFFNAITGGIGFDLKDIGANWSSKKAAPLLDDAIITQLLNNDQTARSILAQDNAWSIQSGTTALSATGTGTNNDAMIGGTTDDTLNGGDGNDFLYGNAGADTLTGGIGDDWLIGGAADDTMDGGTGNDSYTLEGRDTIRDSDGNGILKDKVGNILSGVIEKRADGTYAYLSNPSVSVTLDANLTLTMTLADGSVAVLENFTSGNLGLQLAETPTASPQGINGQEPLTGFNTLNSPNPAAPIIPLTQYNDRYWGIPDGLGLFQGLGGDDQLYADNPTDPSTGTAQPVATLIQNGNTQANSAQAGFFLYGNTGNDTLIAGAANDVLAGGGGNDILIAGAGDDLILGDADYTAAFIRAADPSYTDVATNVSWYHSSPQTFDWTVTPQADGSTLFAPVARATVLYPTAGVTDPADSGNDIIYAGAGNDIVVGGDGNDYLDGLQPLIFDGKMHKMDMRRRIRAATINIGKAANDEAIQAWRVAA